MYKGNEALVESYNEYIGQDKLIDYIRLELSDFRFNQIKIKNRLLEMKLSENIEICMVVINKDYIESKFREDAFLRCIIVDYPDLRVGYTYEIDLGKLAKIIYKENGIIKETFVSI
jgi:hypothetical protein